MSASTIAKILVGVSCAVLVWWLTIGRAGCAGTAIKTVGKKIPVAVRKLDGASSEHASTAASGSSVPEESTPAGKVRVRATYTVQKGDAAGQKRDIYVDVEIAERGQTPAVVVSSPDDDGVVYWESEAVYVPVTVPVIDFRHTVQAGISGDWRRGVSPFVLYSPVTVLGCVYLGVGVDRYSAGFAGSYEFWREWNAGVKYNPFAGVAFDKEAASVQVFLSYRF